MKSKKKHKRPQAAQQPPKKGVTHGKKKIRILDPVSAMISLSVAAIAAVLAGLSNAFGFDKTWYGDILTTAVSVIGFFGLVNLFYLFMDGITVENGECFLGLDSEKKPIRFAVEELHTIRLLNEEGEETEMLSHSLRHVTIQFILRSGKVLSYPANRLSLRTYRAILAYFKL